MKAHRGYEIGGGWCGRIGIFVDGGYQVETVDTEAEAVAKIDGWIADWKAKIAANHPEAADCRRALEELGEA